MHYTNIFTLSCQLNLVESNLIFKAELLQFQKK